MAEDRYKDGLLVPGLGRVADWLKRYWLMSWLGYVCPRLRDPTAVDTELYVVSWFVFGLAISVSVCLFYDYVAAVRWLVYLLAALRGPEIIVRTTTVDFSNERDLNAAFIGPSGHKLRGVDALVWVDLRFELQKPGTQPVTAFYFSIITQLTIGYGDVYATGWLRIIAAAQGLIGALFVIVVLGRAVLSPPKNP